MSAPQVRFIVLPQASEEARLLYACRLVEKAYLDGHSVLVRLESSAAAQSFDELLWRFSDRSFVPHEILRPGAEARTPVRLCHGDSAGCGAEVLVNLAGDVPESFERFRRIAEIVDGDEERRSAGRDRYRFYRGQGIEPETHNAGGAA